MLRNSVVFLAYPVQSSTFIHGMSNTGRQTERERPFCVWRWMSVCSLCNRRCRLHAASELHSLQHESSPTESVPTQQLQWSTTTTTTARRTRTATKMSALFHISVKPRQNSKNCIFVFNHDHKLLALNWYLLTNTTLKSLDAIYLFQRPVTKPEWSD